jgi:hypothetical protein
MAIATQRRITTGPADSIWSIRKADASPAPRKPVAVPAE